MHALTQLVNDGETSPKAWLLASISLSSLSHPASTRMSLSLSLSFSLSLSLGLRLSLGLGLRERERERERESV